jgi:type IV pilus assembly protein PilV
MARQSGVSMVEILVALLVISIGALGYAGLQLRALADSEQAFQRSQAMAIAQDAAERIAVNKPAEAAYVDSDNWPTGVQFSKPANWNACVTAACDADAMAQWDINQLAWMAADLLPGGRMDVVDCAGSQLLCVRVAWNQRTPGQCEQGGTAIRAPDCVVLEVQP